MNFAAGRGTPDDPTYALNRHGEKFLERHAIVAPSSLNRRRLFNNTTSYIRQLRSFQGELVEDGQNEAAALYQDAIEALETARRAQARG